MAENQRSYTSTVALIVVVVIAALAITKIVKTSIHSRTSGPTGDMAMLLKHPFTMMTFADSKGSRDVTANHFEIGFATDKVSGVICNSFSGGYGLSGGMIKAEQVVSTKKACEDTIMDVETAFFEGLRSGMRAQFAGSDKVILTAGDGTSFVLTAKE